MELHTYQKAQTISRVQNGMMKMYFVLWDLNYSLGGAWEEKGGSSGEVLVCGYTSNEHEL